jgi:integrase
LIASVDMSTMYTIMEQDGAKQFLAGKGRNSKSTKSTYAVALAHFQNFLDNKQRTLVSIIKPLKDKQIDVYELLEDFITYILETKNGNDKTLSIKSRTIKAYVTAIRSYLTFKDIDIIPAKFQARVNMPKVLRKDEEAIEVEDIREILLHVNNRRLKPFLLGLGSGGPRTIELASLRLCDLDLPNNTINIREEYTKTKQARYTFISDEAVKFLNEWIAWKYRSRRTTLTRNEENLVFAIGADTDPDSVYEKMRLEFNKVLALVNKAGRKSGAQRRKITLNSFRRFAKTTVADAVNSDFSEWFLGHAKSSYWVKKTEKKWQIYKDKCMKYLTFLDYTVLESTGKNIEAKISEKETEIQLLRQRDQIKDQELQSMKEHIQAVQQSQRQSFEEFKQENRHIIAEAMAEFKATLSPKALERFHKPMKELLEEI